jgi:predicted MPP superfamily phosphohydrolase
MLGLTALGHGCLVVLAVNVVHGLGVNWRRMEFAVLAGLAAAGLAGVALLAWGWSHPWGSWPWFARLYAATCMAVAGLGLPATTLARLTRRPPPGVHGRSAEVELTPREGAGPLVGEGRRGWLLRLPGNESLRPRAEEWRVEVPGLPPECDGLTIVHLTDLHFSRRYGRGFFEAAAELAARREADLVAFTGDLVDDDDCIDWVVPVLSRLRGRLGQFAVLGNHDAHHHPSRVRGELARAGFLDVEGRWVSLDVGGAAVAVGGTSYPWGPELDPAASPDAALRLVLSHTPDLFPRLARQGVDLVLAGHNHGGQVRLPLLGPVVMPSLYSRRYDQGFFRRGRSLLYASRGLGAKHPVRYGCPPELTRITLHPPRRARSSAGRQGQLPKSQPASSLTGGGLE